MHNENETIECAVTITDDFAPAPTPAPLPPAPGGDREQWLASAAALIHGKPLDMPISYGFGKGGTRSAKGYSIHEDASGKPQLFIHPTTREARQLVDRIACALSVSVFSSALAAKLPPFPTEGLPPSTPSDKDGIRQIKCVCPACGFTMRTSQKWIERGLPTCVCGQQIKRA